MPKEGRSPKGSLSSREGWGTFDCPDLLRDELGGTLPKRAKEHNLATFLEEEERVKHLEQVRGWLMDRADHRALRGRHLPDSSHHHLPVRRHSRARNGTGRGRR